MAVYLVDRSLPGITIEQLAAAQGAAMDRTEATKRVPPCPAVAPR